MPTATRTWGRPSPADLPSSSESLAGALHGRPPALESGPPPAYHRQLAAPIARLGRFFPARGAKDPEREVLVSLAQAPLGSRVFLESRAPSGGPTERTQTYALPARAGTPLREFRAVLPTAPTDAERVYQPIAFFNGEEIRGEPFRVSNAVPVPASTELLRSTEASAESSQSALPLPQMTLLAHVDADLPNATVFGQTPEGLRIAFYLSDGFWRGPRIHARYRAEGGDWLLVRKDGVAIPDVRSTLETSDGALLYYELTGKIDLGPGGYERILTGAFPEVAPFSAVGRISTSSDNWSWLNRLTLVAVGIVNLKIRHAHYDLYALQCDPKALTP